MKSIFNFFKWVLGILFILFSIGFFATGEVVLGIILIVGGPLMLPPITRKIFKRKHSSDNPDKEIKMGYIKTIRLVSSVERMIRNFPNNEEKKILALKVNLGMLSNDDFSAVKNHLIQGWDKIINLHNFEDLGSQYIIFFKRLFPNEDDLELTQKMNQKHVEVLIKEKVENDNALDPDEINEIIDKSKSLNVSDFDTADKIKKLFEFQILNWELSKGNFPEVKADFIMQKNEKCIYRHVKCEVLTKKQITKRITYSGPRARIKIAKGLSYNIGSYNVSTQKESVNLSNGVGVVNVSTNRVLFKSTLKTITIKHSSIIDIQPFQNALIITQSSGNPLIFKVNDGMRFYQLLNAAIKSEIS